MWYYKKNNVTIGPVSTEQLKESLTAGIIQPRQAVWKQETESLIFLHAETASSSRHVTAMDFVGGDGETSK